MIKKLLLGLILFCCYIQAKQPPLNILFVVQYFPSLSQIYILNMIVGLIERGHNVFIFSFERNLSPCPLAKIDTYQLLDRVIYEKFPEELPECDIVFCQFGDLIEKILSINAIADWLSQKKLVVCLRGFDLKEFTQNSWNTNQRIFNKVDLFLPVCHYFKNKLLALSCNPAKVIVHHSAIDCSQFYFDPRKMPKKGPINFIAIGRLVRKKGLIYAIKAIAKIAQHYDIHFDIIGEGYQRQALESLIGKLKLQKKITIHGWKTHEEIIAFARKAHIFLLPSVSLSNGNEEGIANALKEAMAMGILSIATVHAGTPELIQDGISGFLVAEKNSEQLAEKINYVLKHPGIWKPIQLKARKKIENEFDTQKLAQELEEIFYDLLTKSCQEIEYGEQVEYEENGKPDIGEEYEEYETL